MKYVLKSLSGGKEGSPRQAYPGDGDRVHPGDLFLALPTGASQASLKRGEMPGERQRRRVTVTGLGVGPRVSPRSLSDPS